MAAGDQLRYVAFYLPQFHPIRENDEWWGPGFTEWRNVARADPLFRGHEQPHIPGDLGFYDLRLAETRVAQAALAARYGIDAFCYFHYWFDGRRLLERPFDEVLRSGEPPHPFLLCWANENWTRVWDGKSAEMLMQQSYSHEDDLRHVRALAETFADPRYVRIDGRPVFLVYRPLAPAGAGSLRRHVANGSGATGRGRPLSLWRQRRARSGHRPRGARPRRGRRVRPLLRPRDAQAVAVGPGGSRAASCVRTACTDRTGSTTTRPSSPTISPCPRRITSSSRAFRPGFDNSPRRANGGATIITGSSPEVYEHWLREVTRRFEPYSPEENLVFVNAWNEWAEGNHLEPSRAFGHGYLEAHQRART